MLFAVLPFTARAQLLERYYPSGVPGYEDWFSDAVLQRSHGEYSSQGVRAGSFTIRPALSESLGYDSNIFGSSQPLGSALAETVGSVGAASNWSRNALSALISFDNVNYFRYPRASYTDWTAALGGKIDIGRDQVTLAYSHITATVLPTQLGAIGLNQPTTYNLDDFRLGYQTSFGRVTVVPAFELGVYRFTNGPAGGPEANETSNDRNTFTGSVTAGYELAPARSVVVVFSGTNASYTTKLFGTPGQNFSDLSVLGGIDYKTAGPFRYRALVGYEERGYVSSQLSGISAPITELDVIWTPTRLTTVTGRVTRSIQSALTTQANGFTYTDARLSVDQEYRRNVLLQGYGEVQQGVFQSGGGTQNVFSAGASATWLLNRRISLIGRYDFTDSTDSTNSTLNSTRSLARLELAFQL